MLTLKHPDLTRTQKDVTSKIVQELNPFDNLYYEVCNEPWVGNVTSEWQNEIVATIVETEAALPARHLISLNSGKLRILDPHPHVAIYNFHHPDIADAVAQNYSLNRVWAATKRAFADAITWSIGPKPGIASSAAADCSAAGIYSFRTARPTEPPGV